MPLTVHQFLCLEDNYGFLVRDEASGAVAAIDTPDADAIAAELERLDWRLDLILNTHWHGDHIGGNSELVRRTGALVMAPGEVARRTHVDRVVAATRCPSAPPRSMFWRRAAIRPAMSAMSASLTAWPS
jgi:hydroxyacylglutathione hydrolase